MSPNTYGDLSIRRTQTNGTHWIDISTKTKQRNWLVMFVLSFPCVNSIFFSLNKVFSDKKIESYKLKENGMKEIQQQKWIITKIRIKKKQLMDKLK